MESRASEGDAHCQAGIPKEPRHVPCGSPYGGSRYYAGLDLHNKYFTLCVLTSEGQVVVEHRRLPAELEPLSSL